MSQTGSSPRFTGRRGSLTKGGLGLPLAVASSLSAVLACLAVPASSQEEAPAAVPQDQPTFAESSDAAQPAPPAEIEDAWIVRRLAEFNPKTLIAFAEAAEPSWHKIEAEGVTLGNLLDGVCGDQPDTTRTFLRKKALALNLFEDADMPLERDTTVALPFCMKLEKDVAVEVLEGQNPSSLLQESYGIAGKETLKAAYERNKASYRSYNDFVHNLRPGVPFIVPYGAEEVLFRPAGPGAPDPLQIVRANEPQTVVAQALKIISQDTGPTEGLASGPPPPPELSSPGSGLVELVSTFAVDPATQPQTCGAPSPPDYRPFDPSKVRAAFEQSLRQRDASIPLGIWPTKVGMIDTGLEGFDDDYFQTKFFFPNEKEYDHKENGIENNPADEISSNFLDDIYGANIDGTGRFSTPKDPNFTKRSHGTQMGSLILGGPDVVATWFAHEAPPPVRLKVFAFARTSATMPTQMANATDLTIAVQYLAEQKVKIINMSLATTFNVSSISQLVGHNDKVLFVVAAGNGRPQKSGVGVSLAQYINILPAVLGGGKQANLVTVGAAGFGPGRAEFSNYSKDHVDLFAPGCDILVRTDDKEFVRVNGTSPAAAITTFAASLVYAAASPDANLRDVRNRLIIGTDYEPQLEGYAKMPGRLNIVKALSLYQDLIETNSQTDYLYGDVTSPRHFFTAGCMNNIDGPGTTDENILKIVPNVLVEGGQKQMQMIVWFRDGNGISEIRCTQKPEAAFWELGVINADALQGTLRLENIKEIVFSSF